MAAIGAGTFFVGKKDHSLGSCVEHQDTNKIMMIKSKHSLPITVSALEHQAKPRWSANCTREILTTSFSYLGMPFGLTNVLYILQAQWHSLRHTVINHFIFAYLDHILIFSSARCCSSSWRIHYLWRLKSENFRWPLWVFVFFLFREIRPHQVQGNA